MEEGWGRRGREEVMEGREGGRDEKGGRRIAKGKGDKTETLITNTLITTLTYTTCNIITLYNEILTYN